MNHTFAIVLAAGRGTRMNSDTHKVLHPLCGKPMMRYVIDSLKTAEIDRLLVVIGAHAEQIKEELGLETEYVLQERQLGTGHAVMQARQSIGLTGCTLVCNGDTPLVTSDTYKSLLSAHQQSGAAITMVTATVDNPSGLGRVVRNDMGEVIRVVEEKDATAAEKMIHEINSGLYCFANSVLFSLLEQVRNDNAQGEYYLTDCIHIAKAMGLPVHTVSVADPYEISGINDRIQLAQLEKKLRNTINETHMKNGVTLIDPDTTYIDAAVSIGKDTVIGPGVTVSGATTIGKNCFIGPGCLIDCSIVGERAALHQAIVRNTVIAEDETVGFVAGVSTASPASLPQANYAVHVQTNPLYANSRQA
ncbi:bifunctional N-acetylglucosamine-1-phosphate uridyltransferase/glucosamine-1-phosphate acetyltransferase [Paenibacillus thalictri]|nr:NTP transferase domain-containing protein [Paenibacillus thalictri]